MIEVAITGPKRRRQGTAFAWQVAHNAFICLASKRFVLMIFRSSGTCPSGASRHTRICSPAPAWHVSQFIPGSRHVVPVAVFLEVVVRRKLADVAVVAGGVERVFGSRPVQRLLGVAGEVPHAASGRVKPLTPAHVVCNWQRLQPATLAGRQEVVDVLAAEDMLDPELPLRRPYASFNNPALVLRGSGQHSVALQS